MLEPESSANTPKRDRTPVSAVALSDGSFPVPASFFNDEAAYDLLIRKHGSPVLPFGAYLLQGSSPVLVDAGIGPDQPPYDGVEAGLLLDSLKAQGLEPSDIEHVVISHLHSDHVGWIATQADGLIFSRAQFYIGRADWQDLDQLGKGLLPTIVDALHQLDEEGRISLLESDTEIVPGVTAIPAPGHTNGHTIVAFEGAQGRALIVGDAVYFPEQLDDLAFAAASDVDTEAALQTRTALMSELHDGSVLLGPHFPGLSPYSADPRR